MNDKVKKQIEKIKKEIDKDVKNNCIVEDLYLDSGIPERLFRDMFRSMFGIRPKQYINDALHKKLLNLMKNGNNGSSHNAYELALELGFKHATSLYGFIKRMTNMTFDELKEKLRAE